MIILLYPLSGNMSRGAGQAGSFPFAFIRDVFCFVSSYIATHVPLR